MSKKIYDLLWKRAEKNEEKKDSKARWENIGVLVENDGKRSLKINVIPVGKDWDGWLTVKERQDKPANEARG